MPWSRGQQPPWPLRQERPRPMLTADRFLRSGKVRDLFDAGPDELLLIASDRISAFDVVLPTEIPDKGKVLTGLSRYWFGQTSDIVPSHLRTTDPNALPRDVDRDQRAALRGRMMLCRRAVVLPV